MSRISLPSILLGLVVVLILLTYMFTHQVDFNEVAVKVRFGQADEQSILREPGLKFRWPWPVETIETYDVRLRTLDTPETEIKTVDGKNVIIGAYAVWSVAHPLQFYKRARTIAEAEQQMRSRISQIKATVIGQSRLSDFVNLDEEQKEAAYDRMLDRMREGVAPELLEHYGIDLKRIGIRRISLPGETTQQVFAAMQQERNNLAATYRQEGRARAEGIRARAEASATQIMEFAKRRAKEIESEGINAARRILEQIEAEDSDFFIWLRWLDALRASLSQKVTIFIDSNSPLWEPFMRPPVATQGKP